ncbi:MAG: hypothetical protein AB7J32_25975 [Pseudonocardia sp.]
MAQVHEQPAPGVGDGSPGSPSTVPLDTRESRRLLADARGRARERHGGSKVGAAFFGWLVAVGLSVILTAIASAVVGGVGAPAQMLPESTTPVPGLSGAAAVAVGVLTLGYLAGGYVAGRLARFDGARNGLLAWVIGLLATAVVALVTATGSTRFTLPGDATLTAAQLSGWVVLGVAAAATLVAALLGGMLGERYHRKLDRAGLPD